MTCFAMLVFALVIGFVVMVQGLSWPVLIGALVFAWALERTVARIRRRPGR